MRLPKSITILGAAAFLVLGGCGMPNSTSSSPSACATTTPGAADTYEVTVRQVDDLTKASIEKDKVVFAALFSGTLPDPASDCSGKIAWPLEIAASARWFQPHTPGPLPNLAPWANADLCPAAYDPPSVKLLDPAHPDAVQPALGPPDEWAGKVDGWVSWQVDALPDCVVDLTATIAYEPYPAAPNVKPWDPQTLSGDWQFVGDRADAPVPSPSPTTGGPITIKPYGVDREQNTMLVEAQGMATRQWGTGIPYIELPFTMPSDGLLTLGWSVTDRSQPSCDVSIDLSPDGHQGVSLVKPTTAKIHADGTIGPYPARGAASPFGALTPGAVYSIRVTSTCAIWHLDLSHYLALTDKVLVDLRSSGRVRTSRIVKIPSRGPLFLQWSTSDYSPKGCLFTVMAESSTGDGIVTLVTDNDLTDDQRGEVPLATSSDNTMISAALTRGGSYRLQVVTSCEWWMADLIRSVPVQ